MGNFPVKWKSFHSTKCAETLIATFRKRTHGITEGQPYVEKLRRDRKQSGGEVTRHRVTITHPRGELVLEPEDIEAIRSVVTVLEGEIVAVKLEGDKHAPSDLGDCPLCGWPTTTVGARAWCVRPYSTGVVCKAFQFARRGGRWSRVRATEMP